MNEMYAKFQFALETVEPFDPVREFNCFFYALSINKYARFPDDFIQTFYWFLFIAALHLFMRYVVFRPLAYRVLPDDDKKRSEMEEEKTKKGSAQKKSNEKSNEKSGEKKKNLPEKALVNKFLTASWKGFSYTCLVLFALFCMWGEDWPLDTAKYWRGWPGDITFWVKQLYFVEFAYYFHATIVIAWEPKMKDTFEMLAHHFATIALMALSYCWSYYRTGAVIMILHDFSDLWMEYAKLCLYSRYNKAGDAFFIIFTLSFLFTRCGLYPIYILSTVWYEARIECPECCGWWIFNSLLFTLQFLHIFWAGLILNILYTAVVKKGVQGDVREEE